jgi:hypothetical protein
VIERGSARYLRRHPRSTLGRMTFTGTVFESVTRRWALFAVVAVGLILFAAHLAGWTAVETLALNPQPEPPGVA